MTMTNTKEGTMNKEIKPESYVIIVDKAGEVIIAVILEDAGKRWLGYGYSLAAPEGEFGYFDESQVKAIITKRQFNTLLKLLQGGKANEFLDKAAAILRKARK